MYSAFSLWFWQLHSALDVLVILLGEIPAFYFSALAQLERQQSGFCSISNRFWWLQTRGQPQSAHRDRVEIYRSHYHKLEQISERQQSHEIFCNWKLSHLLGTSVTTGRRPPVTGLILLICTVSWYQCYLICTFVYMSFSYFQGLISASLWTRGTLNEFSEKLKSNLHQWVLHTTLTMTVWLSDIVFKNVFS